MITDPTLSAQPYAARYRPSSPSPHRSRQVAPVGQSTRQLLEYVAGKVRRRRQRPRPRPAAEVAHAHPGTAAWFAALFRISRARSNPKLASCSRNAVFADAPDSLEAAVARSAGQALTAAAIRSRSSSEISRFSPKIISRPSTAAAAAEIATHGNGERRRGAHRPPEVHGARPPPRLGALRLASDRAAGDAPGEVVGAA